MRKAAFLDRDGVINRKAPEDNYVTRWEDVQILPGVAEAIALLNRSGFLVIVVSNQRGVARKLITDSALEMIHERMRAELAHSGARIDAVYYCPHELQPPCGCRKPQPGMLLRAASIHGIDLRASWMIGDSDKDVVAGKNAGCRTVRLLTAEETHAVSADYVARSLLEATHRIAECEGFTSLNSVDTRANVCSQ